MGKFPKRILFYRGRLKLSRCGSKLTSLADGVSEGEFEVIVQKELDSIRSISCFPEFFSYMLLTAPFLSDTRGLR